MMKTGMIKLGWLRNAVLCLWAGLAGNAWATDQVFDAGVLTSLAPYTQIVNHVLPNEALGTAFVDFVNFKIADGANTSSVAVNLNLQPFLNIDNLLLSLYSGQNATGSLLEGPVGSGVTLVSSLLTNTDYSLQITGLTSGSLGGSYSTAIAVVPEADAWAMMLIGLGMVGFVLRRNARALSAPPQHNEVNGNEPNEH